MRVKGVSQRLDFSTRRLSQGEWRLLAAIAVERELARSLVLKLGGSFGVLDALPGLDECDDLLAWSAGALERAAGEGTLDAEERSNGGVSAVSLAQTLAEHAV